MGVRWGARFNGSTVQRFNRARQRGFGCLDIPVAIFAPKEAVKRLRHFAELVFGERGVDFADGLVELEQNPFVIAGEQRGIDFAFNFGSVGRGARRGRRGPCAPLHLAETAGVPEFVAEVAGQFHLRKSRRVPRDLTELVALASPAIEFQIFKNQVLAHGNRTHDPEPHGVRSVFLDKNKGIGRVLLALGHLVSVPVPDETSEIDVAKRHFAHVLVPRHDHARDPEENDVRPGDKVGGRVEGLQGWILGVPGFVAGPAHRGEGPEPGTAPGVEDVGVLGEAEFTFNLFRD